MSDTEKTFDIRLRSAERAHDARRRAVETVSSQVLSFSNAAMRAPALVAAGGVAAVLGFYSANYSRLASNPDTLTAFNGILFWLFASLLLTVIAPGLAYFAQIFFSEAMEAEEYHWEHPFIRPTAATKRWNLAGNIVRWIAIIAVTASIVCLAIGGLQFLSLVH